MRITLGWLGGFLISTIFLGLQAQAEEIPKKPDLAALVHGNTAFALDLYRELSRKPGNIFFSPFSISRVFGPAFAGAGGQTADEMAKILHFDLPADRLHPAFRQLSDDLFQTRNDAKVEFDLADGMWIQQGLPILPGYLSLVKKEYGVETRSVDFKSAAEKARLEINAWVEGKTRDKIKDLFPPYLLDGLTELVMVNAIYFKGSWSRAFKPALTGPASFTTSAQKIMTVSMMQQTAEFDYAKSGSMQILSLDYGQGGFSMLLLLPPARDSLDAWSGQLSVDLLGQWQKALRRQKVVVYIPKMKLTQQINLKPTLMALGLKRPFMTTADFSGLTGSKDGLFISAAVHKAFVEVNEEGTEAAAATGMVVSTTGYHPGPPLPVFCADHPFIFFILEKTTGTIMFMGRVEEPEHK